MTDKLFLLTGKEAGAIKSLLVNEIHRLEKVAPNRSEDIKDLRKVLQSMKEGVPAP